MFVTCQREQLLQNGAVSEVLCLHANSPCSAMNARQPTFTLPQPPQSQLLQPTPAKKSATLCSLPSHLDLSMSCSRADKPGLSHGSATTAINAIVSNESDVKVWHHSHRV